MAPTPLKIATGELPRSIGGQPLQDAQSSKFQDATATPQISPLTSVTTVKTIVPPSYAITCTLTAVGANMRVGDNSTLSGSGDGHGYYFVSDGQPFDYKCADGANIYAMADSGTITTLSFCFATE